MMDTSMPVPVFGIGAAPRQHETLHHQWLSLASFATKVGQRGAICGLLVTANEYSASRVLRANSSPASMQAAIVPVTNFRAKTGYMLDNCLTAITLNASCL